MDINEEKRKKNVTLILKMKNNLNNKSEYDIKINNNNINEFYICKIENKIEIYEADKFMEEAIKNKISKILFRIRKSSKEGIYEIINPINIFMDLNKKNIKLLDNKCWYIIPREKGYIINEGDIIKFGRKMYEIIGIKIGNRDKNNNSILKEDEMINYISNINKKRKIFDFSRNLLQKKYKLEEYIEDIKVIPEKIFGYDNPKVNLCNCKEKFLFYKDIKKEIKNNLFIDKKNNYITYFIKNKFYCEKCNTEYPLRFKLYNSNDIKNLIDIEYNENKDYIILEYLNNMDYSNIKKVHLIELFDKKEIIIGRDIIDYGDNIKKSYTSRKQCSFYLDKINEKIFLKNISENNETLVLIKDTIKLRKEEINFQVEMCKFIANIEEF